MIRTQIYLTHDEKEQLKVLTKQTGLHLSEMIREAIDQYILNKGSAKKSRDQVLKSAAGLWADRDDLNDIQALRSEFDRELI